MIVKFAKKMKSSIAKFCFRENLYTRNFYLQWKTLKAEDSFQCLPPSGNSVGKKKTEKIEN